MYHTETKFYIGPAGWSYPDWAGIVYPRSGKADRLMTIANMMKEKGIPRKIIFK